MHEGAQHRVPLSSAGTRRCNADSRGQQPSSRALANACHVPLYAHQQVRGTAIDQVELGDGGARVAGAADPGRDAEELCSQYRNAPPKAVADAILAREKAAIVYPADGKLMGDWKKGEKLAQSGYGGPLHRLPAARRERRQLLRLPPARHQGAELRHAGAKPAASMARTANSPRPRSRRSTSGSTTRRRPCRAPTCPAWGPAGSSAWSRSRTWWHT